MNIYVGNLCLDTTEWELRRLFWAFGSLDSISIMNDNYIGSGQPKGYAYVEMPSRVEAEAAIDALNGSTFKAKTLSVVQALPLSMDHAKTSRFRTR
jgi:RNA recognition motif-containing protein